MPRTFVYSFEDTIVTINHPGKGSYSAYGSGIGSVGVSYTNDVTAHDVAADETVIISKMVRRNGTVVFDVTQASDFNKYLNELATFLEVADSSQFALATIDIENKSTGDKYHCTGVSHQKRADNNYNSQAQNRSWTWMCANISSM